MSENSEVQLQVLLAAEETTQLLSQDLPSSYSYAASVAPLSATCGVDSPNACVVANVVLNAARCDCDGDEPGRCPNGFDNGGRGPIVLRQDGTVEIEKECFCRTVHYRRSPRP